MRGALNWLPSLRNVSCIDWLSQCSQYVKIPSGVGGGGGVRVPGGGRKSKLGSRAENPNWDPRFKPTTALGAKIKKMTMKKIMEKANFDESTCVSCNEAGNKRSLTFHAKGSCQTGCQYATDHKQLPTAVVGEMYTYISDGCRWGVGRRQLQLQHKKIVSMPVLPPSALRVSPVVPQCAVPVLSNISSERTLYTSNTDIGKLSCLSCPKINIITVPCVVSPELRSLLLSPTSKNLRVSRWRASCFHTSSTLRFSGQAPCCVTT